MFRFLRNTFYLTVILIFGLQFLSNRSKSEDKYPSIIPEKQGENSKTPLQKLQKKLPESTIAQALSQEPIVIENQRPHKKLDQIPHEQCEPLAHIQPESPLAKDTFYTIPDSKIDSLAERIKIVHEILLLHRRAYDYQKLTLKELKAIKKSLNESALSKI